MIQIQYAGGVSPQELFIRDMSVDQQVEKDVSSIINAVIKDRDHALYHFAKQFDGATLQNFTVTEEEWNNALKKVSPSFLSVLEDAFHNIWSFHRHQQTSSFSITDRSGIVLGQKTLPLQKVGIYVPGGTASYPSTVLMNAIPAKIAGVPHIYMTTPPQEDGSISPEILAAAKIAGIERVFKSGGAQAIAALAYGTESIPQVDKIVGPGNAYVAAAKRAVFGKVDIDMVAGPSEILILADNDANPAFLAADMLSQAEHDRFASSILLTTSKSLAEQTAKELETQLNRLKRREIAQAAIENQSKILIIDSLEEGIALANQIAPEHLELAVKEPFALLGAVQNAGSIFLGYHTPEPLGDYFAGPNHTLPTGGRARFSSPLGVQDFVKRSSFLYYDKTALAQVKERVEEFAETEGLTAHAASIAIRFEEEEK